MGVSNETVHFVTGSIWNTELLQSDMYNCCVEREWIKKDHPKNRALVSCHASSDALMERCETLLYEWEELGPKCIGLPKGNRDAATLEDARAHLNDLISDAASGKHLQSVSDTLQIVHPRRFTSLPNSCYLQALTAVGANDLVQ